MGVTIGMSNILIRRQTHFVLWRPSSVGTAPELVIGRLKNGNPPTFQQLARRTLQPAMSSGTPIDGLFELDASTRVAGRCVPLLV